MDTYFDVQRALFSAAFWYYHNTVLIKRIIMCVEHRSADPTHNDIICYNNIITISLFLRTGHIIPLSLSQSDIYIMSWDCVIMRLYIFSFFQYYLRIIINSN